MQSAAASNARDAMRENAAVSRKENNAESGFNQPQSTLARLEPALDLVDNVNPAFAANQTVVAVTAAQ